MRLSTFNPRVETVTTKPFFREAFKRTRCLISASGYYEGQDTLEGKQPHYFTRADGQVISLAGPWDRQISELPYQWWWSSNLAPAHSNKLRRLFIPECPVLTLDVPTEKGNGPSAAQLSASRSAVGRSRS